MGTGIVVALQDSQGRYLMTAADYDAPGLTRFARVTDAKAFLLARVGREGWRVSDDCELIAETVATFRVFEDGNDLSRDFADLIRAEVTA